MQVVPVLIWMQVAQLCTQSLKKQSLALQVALGKVVTGVICPHSTQWTQDEIQQMTILNHKPGRQTKP